MCIEAPESSTNIRSSVFQRFSTGAFFSHRRIKRSFVLGLELKYFLSPNSMLLCGRTLLVVRSFSLQTSARKDFAHEVHLFGYQLEMAFFLSRIWISYPVRPEDFVVCPAEAFNLVWPAFRRIDFFDAKFLRYTTLDFSFRIATAPWVLSLFDLLLGFSSPSVCRLQAIIAMDAPVSRLAITTHGRMPIITWRLSTPRRQGILAQIAGLASRLIERLSSVRPFPVGTEEDACPLPFRLCSLSTAVLRLDTHVFFAASADISRFPEASECRKRQESTFFNKTHLPSTETTLQSSAWWRKFVPFSHGRTLCNLALNPEFFTFWACSMCNFTHTHTFSVFDDLVVLLLAEFLV